MALADIRRNCFLAVKAAQNLRAAKLGFERLREAVDSDDEVMLQSLFYYSVIKYGKPFSETRIENSRARYDVGLIASQKGFSHITHQDLITLRNKLVAHDDAEVIEPRLLSYGFSVRYHELFIPVSYVAANSSLGYPASVDTVSAMFAHASAAESGAVNDLLARLKEFRDYTISIPGVDEALTRYSRHVEVVNLPESGANMPNSDLYGESYLDINKPLFRSVIDGFRYEEFRVRCNFYGPESIQLPGGWTVKISPPDTDESL